MNVKKGDLAIVIGADVTPEMVGRIVEVVRRACDGEIVATPEGSMQIVAKEPAWIVKGIGATLPVRLLGTARLIAVTERAFADRLLRPVSGLPVEEYDELMNKEPA